MMRHVPTVLVVDDEPEVGRYISATLSRNGFRSLLALGGRAALALYRTRSRDIDLVLTDVVMFDLAGPELIAVLRDINPKLRVLYMSGYASGLSRREAKALDGFDVLSKPFTASELTDRVATVLRQHASS